MRKSRLAAEALTTDVRKQIATEYAAGAGCTGIARRYGFSETFIRGVVSSMGVALRPRAVGGYFRKLTREKVASMISEYAAGDTCDSLAEKYGIKSCSVWQLLKKRGVTRPPSEANRRYAYDETAFDAPLSDNAAYWIGFLMTDGCIADPRGKNESPTIKLQLAAKDESHIESFRSFLRAEHPIQTTGSSKYAKSFNSGPAKVFSIRSKSLVRQLATYGVVPRKTHIAKVVGLELNPHFWRGCIDGDGSIGIYLVGPEPRYPCPNIRLCGASRALIDQFSNFLRSISPKCKATVSRGNHTWTVGASGIYALESIRAMYATGGISLARKQIIANSIMEKSASEPKWCHRFT